MIPPNLVARLAALAVTTLATTVVPVLVQDRPILRWTWGRFGPVIETRVQDRLQDRLAPAEPKQPEIVVPVSRPKVPVAPKVYNDGVTCTVPACFNPHQSGPTHYRPILNPNGLCRPHWWRAGPVRRAVSLPFRLFRR